MTNSKQATKVTGGKGGAKRPNKIPQVSGQRPMSGFAGWGTVVEDQPPTKISKIHNESSPFPLSLKNPTQPPQTARQRMFDPRQFAQPRMLDPPPEKKTQPSQANVFDGIDLGLVYSTEDIGEVSKNGFSAESLLKEKYK